MAYNTLYVHKKRKELAAARKNDKIPRTDRLDGGAKLEERRRLAEEHRAQSSFNDVPQEVLCPHCGHQDFSK